MVATVPTPYHLGPQAQLVKNQPAGDLGSIPELGRSPGEGNDNPLQYPSSAQRFVWAAKQALGKAALVHRGVSVEAKNVPER